MTKAGVPCRAQRSPNKTVCRWHDASPEAKAKHLTESRKGGLSKAYGALPCTDALAADPSIANLDLSTVEGLKALLAATLGALAKLPFDIRVSTGISQVAQSQRIVVVDADFDARLKALEGQSGPRLVQQSR